MENTSTPSATARPVLPSIAELIARLRAAGRAELIHYAGAAHRDVVAWHVCAEYLAHPTLDELTLRSRALKAAHGWDVSPEHLRAAGGRS